MKKDLRWPGNSSYSTFVSVETGDMNASMRDNLHHVPAEQPRSQ